MESFMLAPLRTFTSVPFTFSVPVLATGAVVVVVGSSVVVTTDVVVAGEAGVLGVGYA